jgi:putative oxidoreductase
MKRWLGRYSEPVYSIMRFVVGLTFACHGAQKMLGAFGGQFPTGKPLMILAGVIELGGGALIALGLFASYAAFVASGQMAAAYFMAHASGGFWPMQNKGELAVVYCFVFLYIATQGSGHWSVDRMIGNKR